MERFSNKIAIAPTASISIICGGASPGIEPVAANAYTHKTLSGSFAVKSPYLEKLLQAKGVKSLYYCRSKSIQRPESAASWHRTKMANDTEPKQLELGEEPKKYEECLACQ